MLEQKIEALNAKLDATIAALEALTVAVYTQPVKVDPEEDLPVVGKMAERQKVETEEKPKAETETAEQPELIESEAAPSRDDLQELCMTIVRKDRSKKTTVKDVISSFGGAATLNEVADDKLAELKVKLEALK